MNRRIALISSVSLGLLLSVTTLAILKCDNAGSKVTVSFVYAETCNGPFPSFDRSEKLAFDVRNAGSKHAFFDVSAIEDEHGNWVPSLHVLGDVEAGPSTRLYLYLPLGSHPHSVRIRMHKKASAVQKTLFALRLLIEKASGRYPGKPVWIDELMVPAREFIVKLDKEADPTGSGQRRER